MASSGWCRGSAHGSGLTERAVGAVPVEVVLIVGQGRYGVGLVDDEDAVEEFTSDAADESLGVAFARGARTGS